MDLGWNQTKKQNGTKWIQACALLYWEILACIFKIKLGSSALLNLILIHGLRC